MSRYPKIDLAGAVVAITGAAQGIGRATAEAFVERGAQVAIGDLDLDLAKQTAAAIGASAHHLDVSDRDSFASFLAEVAATHGDLDVLVNNAGVMPNGAFLDLDDRTDRLQFDVNVFGVINGMKLVLPGMVERGHGHVVNVASLAGKFPVRGLAVYNATKFAIVGLTAATRLEFEDQGVSISAILPGAVDTGLASGLSMAPLPKVPASAVAKAVVDTVKTRKAETAVPSYVGGLATAASVTPEPVLRRVRKVMRDDRALKDDSPERVAYRDRLNSQK